jgi:glycosyltransferase involved in cell wall biosynthesis
MTPPPPIPVLHLITDLDRGGAETMLARLVCATDRARFRSIVVSLTDRGTLGPEIAAAGVAVHALGMRRAIPPLIPFIRLLRLIRGERPRLLQTWLYDADFMGLLAAWLTPRLPLLWNLRGSDFGVAEYGMRMPSVRRFLALFSRRPAVVLVNSRAGQRFHEAVGYRPRRWELVPNGFDTDVFRPDPAARLRQRRTLGVAPATLLVGMIARVDPMKDHPTFLAAAARVAATEADAAFLLAGRGTESLPVPSALAGRCHALGERRDLPEILPALDLAVLSSAFAEGFPNVIGEAMAAGVPCIATDVGDAAAIIGDTGAIVPPRDPAALADAILAWLARGAGERAAAGAAARQRIVDRYSLASVVARYEALYAEFAAKGPAA